MSASDSDLALAHCLADVADGISMRFFRAGPVVAEEKPDGSPVTAADREIELAMRETVAIERPTDAFLGEEYGAVGNGQRRWIVDAIDGTYHFVHGRTDWSTLIALEDHDEIVLGVVSEAARQLRTWAARGDGAWRRQRNDQPSRIRVSQRTSLSDAVVMLSSDRSGLSEPRRRAAEGFLGIWPEPQKRQDDPPALRIAMGMADVYLLAAGDLMGPRRVCPDR